MRAANRAAAEDQPEEKESDRASPGSGQCAPCGAPGPPRPDIRVLPARRASEVVEERKDGKEQERDDLRGDPEGHRRAGRAGFEELLDCPERAAEPEADGRHDQRNEEREALEVVPEVAPSSGEELAPVEPHRAADDRHDASGQEHLEQDAEEPGPERAPAHRRNRGRLSPAGNRRRPSARRSGGCARTWSPASVPAKALSRAGQSGTAAETPSSAVVSVSSRIRRPWERALNPARRPLRRAFKRLPREAG